MRALQPCSDHPYEDGACEARGRQFDGSDEARDGPIPLVLLVKKDIVDSGGVIEPPKPIRKPEHDEPRFRPFGQVKWPDLGIATGSWPRSAGTFIASVSSSRRP